jgi:hypothetical protein
LEWSGQYNRLLSVCPWKKSSAGYKVAMEIVENILVIVGDPQGILDEQLRTHLLHILIVLIKYKY